MKMSKQEKEKFPPYIASNPGGTVGGKGKYTFKECIYIPAQEKISVENILWQLEEA